MCVVATIGRGSVSRQGSVPIPSLQGKDRYPDQFAKVFGRICMLHATILYDLLRKINAIESSFGNLSGAHFNPVVTLAFALRRDLQWSRVPGYWAAQFAGAILAALLLLALFGPVKHLGATEPHYGILPSLIFEVILTFILITVILATATEHSLVGHNAAIAVGGTVALDGLFGGPISGASMNPALSLGPYFVSGQLSNAWLYVVGPVLGGLIAVGMAWLLRGGTTQEAVKTAGGE